MNIVLKNFSEVKNIKFNPYDILSEAAFGISSVNDIINFINNYNGKDKEYLIAELRKASESTLEESSNEDEINGANIIKDALSRL